MKKSESKKIFFTFSLKEKHKTTALEVATLIVKNMLNKLHNN